MPMYVQWPSSPALVARIDSIRAAAKPGGPASTRALADLRAIVIDDHRDKMLGGVDRYGRPRAPLAAATLKKPGRGPGPSLVPRDAASRYVTTFEAVWQPAASGVTYLAMRFRGFVSAKGFPIPVAHEHGARRPGTRWRLPARPVMGITPKGWAKVRARMTRFAHDLLRGG